MTRLPPRVSDTKGVASQLMAVRRLWQRQKFRGRRYEGGGVSFPWFGFQLPVRGTTPHERLLDLIDQLETKRALSTTYDSEYEELVSMSIGEVRDFIAAAASQFRRDAPRLRTLLLHLRDECNRYLTKAPERTHDLLRAEYRTALHELRESFRVTLAAIGKEFDVPEASEFAKRIERGSY